MQLHDISVRTEQSTRVGRIVWNMDGGSSLSKVIHCLKERRQAVTKDRMYPFTWSPAVGPWRILKAAVAQCLSFFPAFLTSRSCISDARFNSFLP
jgi:hypothetical protein